MTADATLGLSRERSPVRRRESVCGVLLSSTAITAFQVQLSGTGVRATEVLARRLEPPTGDASWPSLDAALDELAQLIRAPAVLDVALLPPLGRTKRIELPPISVVQAGRLLAHNARRYFALGAEPVATGLAQWSRQAGDARASGLAVCAPEAIVQSLLASAEQSSLRVRTITTAAAALARGVHALSPTARRDRVLVVVCDRGWREAIHTDRGCIVSCRTLRDSDEETLDGQLRHDGSVSDSPRRTALGRHIFLSGDEMSRAISQALAHPDATQPMLDDLYNGQLGTQSPLALAAVGAVVGARALPSLLPEVHRAAQRRDGWRRVAMVGAAACLLLMSAGGLHLWALRRELDAVQARRRELALPVMTAVAHRRSAEELRARLEALRALADEPAEWIRVLPALASALPDSAHLTSMSIGKGHVQLSGLAGGGVAVLPALARSPTLRGITISSPLRRDQVTGRERFDISIALDGPRPEPPRPGVRTIAIRAGEVDLSLRARESTP